MIVVTAVSTRAVGTAAEEIFVPAIIVGTIVPTKIVGTAVPTIIVETAYYWKSCILPNKRFSRIPRYTIFSMSNYNYDVSDGKAQKSKDKRCSRLHRREGGSWNALKRIT